ncbi:MAG TPA: hypothetical protein RMH99_21470 [Sandaracinaceae bacterium LLY-WYZ-13_1]|nr:hypothetical protein [Sandaracinaceae bacterium LLY-WYZ-13_1]
MKRTTIAALTLMAGWTAGCSDGNVGSLTFRANGIHEARSGISSEQTADGWAVEYDHAVLVLTGVRLGTTAGEDAMVQVDPVAVELVPEPAVVFELEGIAAQRWDRTSYHLGPPPDATQSVGVDASILERMQREGWSSYYEGRLVAPEGTTDADGEPVTEVPFELGFPVEVDYEFCVAGHDGTNGVVVPVKSSADYEITWHLTHLFFDSFAEDSALRVEPFAALWDGEDPLTMADLDVPLGGLRGIDGGPLTDDFGNPVVYIPGMSGADTLREFVLSGRPGHFNGIPGFCMTDLRIVE